jgi:hypothetical protein
MTQLRSAAVARANTPAAAQAGGKSGSRAVAATPALHRHPSNTVPRRGEWPPLLQAKLTVGRPGDLYEQGADRVADEVMRMPDPAVATSGVDPTPIRALSLQRRCAKCEEEALQRHPQHPETGTESSGLDSVARVLRQGGRPLDPAARGFFEPRFGRDFGDVRIHTGSRASASARAVNALAYTVGRDVVFDTGQYAPHSDSGRRLLAHELTHVVQQSGGDAGDGRMLQRFTSELADDNRILIKPERGDSDADLDRALCPAIKERKIAGRTSIDVTACFPPGAVKAMTAGPYNCSDFVRRARGESPAGGAPDVKWLLTPTLWTEFLGKGFRVRSFGVVKEDGKVEAAEGLSWKQVHPSMGDLVFMKGGIILKKGAREPDPAGDTFTVTWDHVGFFIVRSRAGLDDHLAKDGDENPVGIYHTGTELEEGMTPGAYVKGAESLLAYLGLPGPSEATESKPYRSGPMSDAYWKLTDLERERINAETDRKFRERTGVTRKLDWDDPKDLPLARTWLRIRDEVMAAREAP